jgi:hypothetical protein
VIFGVAVVAAVSLWRWYSSLPPQLSTSAFAATVALITFLATKNWERRRDIEREQRSNRIPCYQKVLTTLLSYPSTSSLDEAKATEELKKTFTELNPQMMIWGSDPVVAAYVKWRSSIGSGSALEDMFRLGQLLLAIRKDVGHENKGIDELVILQVFINDLPAAIANEVKKQASVARHN